MFQTGNWGQLLVWHSAQITQLGRCQKHLVWLQSRHCFWIMPNDLPFIVLFDLIQIFDNVKRGDSLHVVFLPWRHVLFFLVTSFMPECKSSKLHELLRSCYYISRCLPKWGLRAWGSSHSDFEHLSQQLNSQLLLVIIACVRMWGEVLLKVALYFLIKENRIDSIWKCITDTNSIFFGWLIFLVGFQDILSLYNLRL